MTLCWACVNKVDNSAVFISDLLLTNEKLQKGFSGPLGGSSGPLRRLGRKSYRPHERILFQYSGSYLAARAVAREISRKKSQVLNNANDEILKEIIDTSISKEESAEVSILLSVITNGIDGPRLRIFNHSFSSEIESQQVFYYSGTGAIFAEGIRYIPGEIGPLEISGGMSRAMTVAIKFLGELTLQEIALPQETHSTHIGGWYKMIAVIGEKFKPLTMTVNTVTYKNENGQSALYPKLRLTSNYVEAGLILIQTNLGKFFQDPNEPKRAIERIWGGPELVGPSKGVLSKTIEDLIYPKSDLCVHLVDDGRGGIQILCGHGDLYMKGPKGEFLPNNETLSRIVRRPSQM